MLTTQQLFTILILALFWNLTTSFLPLQQQQQRCFRNECRIFSSAVDENVHDVAKEAASSEAASSEAETSSIGPLSMTVEELADVLGGFGRAQLAWDCYSIGVDPQLFFSSEQQEDDEVAMIQQLFPSKRRTQTLGPDALQRLASITPSGNNNNNTCCIEGGVATLSDIRRSSDRTTKLLLQLADGFEVETVIIPRMEEGRSTLCISSQVGCRQGCTFCATGQMGKLRSLSSDEILVQMFFARKLCRLEPQLPPVTNVVFMGMGEPADNADQVIAASRILTKRGLFQLSASKVTISTVAPTPESFRALAAAECVLAWSVHAVNDTLRRRLVPTTKYSMKELRQGMIDALLSRPKNFKRTAMLEVALIQDVNDGLQEADDLAEFARYIMEQVPGCKLIVNLIPYNEVFGGVVAYRQPSNERVVAFQKQLWNSGIHAHVRTTRGDDESAACGQLATSKKKKKKKSQL